MFSCSHRGYNLLLFVRIHIVYLFSNLIGYSPMLHTYKE